MSAPELIRAARRLFPISAAVTVLSLLSGLGQVFADDARPDAPTSQQPTEADSETPDTFAFYALKKVRWEDEERVRTALRRRISVDFNEIPLREALESVAAEVGARIRFDEAGVSESDYDVPTTLNAEDTEAFRVVRALLKSNSVSDFREYYLDGGSIVVTQSSRVRLATRTYDLTKLVDLGFRLETGPPHEIDSYWDDHSTNSGDFFWGGFGDTQDTSNPVSPSTLRIVGLAQWEDELPEDLVRATSLGNVPDGHWFGKTSTLQQMVYFYTSGPWYELDGIGGTASIFGARLTVRHNERTHQEIEELIASLTQAAEQPPGGPPVALSSGLDAGGYAALAQRHSVNYESMPVGEVLDDLSQRFDFPYRIDGDEENPESLGRVRSQLVSLEMEDEYVYDILLELSDLMSWSLCVARGTVWFGGGGCCDLQYSAIYDARDFDRSIRRDLTKLLRYETSGPWFELDGIGGHLNLLDNGLLIVNQTPYVHGEIALWMEQLRQQGATEAFHNPADAEWTTRIYPIENADAIDWLTDAIRTFVQPDTWDASGGEAAISGGGHTLIIRQTGAGHREVAHLLERIEWAHGYVREHLPEAEPENADVEYAGSMSPDRDDSQ